MHVQSATVTKNWLAAGRMILTVVLPLLLLLVGASLALHQAELSEGASRGVWNVLFWVEMGMGYLMSLRAIWRLVRQLCAPEVETRTSQHTEASPPEEPTGSGLSREEGATSTALWRSPQQATTHAYRCWVAAERVLVHLRTTGPETGEVWEVAVAQSRWWHERYLEAHAAELLAAAPLAHLVAFVPSLPASGSRPSILDLPAGGQTHMTRETDQRGTTGRGLAAG